MANVAEAINCIILVIIITNLSSCVCVCMCVRASVSPDLFCISPLFD